MPRTTKHSTSLNSILTSPRYHPTYTNTNPPRTVPQQPSVTMRTVSLAVALAAVSSSLVIADSPDPLPAMSTSLSGNGCPQGSASGSDTSFTFTRFSANAADGSTKQTLNCEAHSSVSGSGPGWQVAVSAVDAKGHVTLDPGARLDYYTTTFFSQNADATVRIMS
jgi:hypothetical protein